MHTEAVLCDLAQHWWNQVVFMFPLSSSFFPLAVKQGALETAATQDQINQLPLRGRKLSSESRVKPVAAPNKRTVDNLHVF